MKEILELADVEIKSEDDLIMKVVIPFFYLLGYEKKQFELKYPVSSYRPNKVGRKPEADCVFFSNSEHNVNTSLLVVEVKRQNQPPAEEQARFYSANLFVPFYITWEGLEFELYQLHSFQAPNKIGRYILSEITSAEFSDLKDILTLKAITSFCEKNEIKRFDFDDKKREIEANYIKNLYSDLRHYKVLDLSRTLDLIQGYVPLYVQNLSHCEIQEEKMEHELNEGIHPRIIEEKIRERHQSFIPVEILDRLSTIAIIGDPGAGKTTLLKYLCIQHCNSDSSRLPIFIAIRELVATEQTILEAINSQIKRYGSTSNPETISEMALNEGRVLLCVDGLDELDIQNAEQARKTLRKLAFELSCIMGKHPQNVIVISARRESWPTCRPEIPASFQEFEILPFSTSSIRAFIAKWFDNEDITLGESLIDEFRLRGWPEFASNPLLLALTCVVYEKRGRLPDRHAVLYQRCIDVMLEEWDATRRISRRENVQGFTPERKLDILAEVALSFHIKRRFCFSRKDVIKELEIHLPEVGLSSFEAGNVFEEISAQHGLLRSWSFEDYYAFPHLVFQEFLTAKALRDRPEGFKELIKYKDDPLWHSIALIYTGMGDATDFISELLKSKNNILHSPLFLAAECIGVGTKLREVDLRHKVIQNLKILTEDEIIFLKNRAIDALASIETPEAFDIIKSLIRVDSGQKITCSYAAKYVIKIEGETISEEVVEKIIKSYESCPYLIKSLNWLPQRKAISLLENIITSRDYPIKQSNMNDPGIRHRRRDAAFLLAKIGDDDSIPILKGCLKQDNLSDFEKEGIITAIASIRHPQIPLVLNEILNSDDIPIDCKVEAAHHLGPNNQNSKKYLLSIVADNDADCYDRRDAVGALCDFKLNDNDIPILEKLLNDSNIEFYGGPSIAAKAIASVGSSEALHSLQVAFSFWEKSDNDFKDYMLESIEEQLILSFNESNLEKLINRYLDPMNIKMNFDLPDIVFQFYSKDPEKASKLFIEMLNNYNDEIVFGKTLTFAFCRILPELPLTEPIISAVLDLAKQMPNDEMIWDTINKLWKRRDIDYKERELFFNISYNP